MTVYSPGSSVDDDRGFEVVRRLESGRLDFGFLRVFPVVVARDEHAVLIKLEDRVGQCVGNRRSVDRERRPDPPNDDLFRISAVNNQPADQDIRRPCRR